MKKKTIVVLLCGALILAAAGCGSSHTDSEDGIVDAAYMDEPTDEDTYVYEDEGDDSVVIAIEEPFSVGEDIVCDVNDLSEDQLRMYGPMGSLIYCYDTVSATGHKWADAGWETLSTLVNDFYTVEEAGTKAYGDANNFHLILASFLKECASAMYADFDGELPPTPEPSKVAAWGIQYQQGEYYDFAYGDRGEDSSGFVITSWVDHSDGTCSVEMQEWLWDPVQLHAIYDIELVKNKYTESKTYPYFIYSVASITENDEKTEEYLAGNPATSYSYVLYDSDYHYYTEDELSYLTAYGLQVARNEIYARHGIKFDDEDMREYFEDQAWYQGTIESSDFSDDLLNDYEKANISLIESMEDEMAQRSAAPAVQENFEYADLDGLNFDFSIAADHLKTKITVYEDGTFEGSYYDLDEEMTGDGYPNGTSEYCKFSGEFAVLASTTNDYAYYTTVKNMEFEYIPDTYMISDDLMYIFTEPYGIGDGDEIRIYLPGAPVAELPEEFVDSIPSLSEYDYMPSYGIYDKTTGVGFYGYPE